MTCVWDNIPKELIFYWPWTDTFFSCSVFCSFQSSIFYVQPRLLMWAFCSPQHVPSPALPRIRVLPSRVKSVTLRCVSPPLCDHDAPPTMLFSQHATRPLIPHANIRFLRPPARPPHSHLILPSSCSSPSSTCRLELPTAHPTSLPFSHFHGKCPTSPAAVSSLSFVFYPLPALFSQPSPCRPPRSGLLWQEQRIGASMSSHSPQW